MRICLLSTTYPPASDDGDRRRWMLAVEFARRGHDVHLVACGSSSAAWNDQGVHVLIAPVPSQVVDDAAAVTVDMLLTRSQALYEGLQWCDRDCPFDIVDVPLHQAQGFVTLQCYRGPMVVSLLDTSTPMALVDAEQAERLLQLDRVCLEQADGILVESPAAYDALVHEYRIAPDHGYGVVGRNSAAPDDVAVGQAVLAAKTDSILAYYQQVIDRTRATPEAYPVYQVMEALDVGDAVSNITRRNAAILAELGQPAVILARHAHGDLTNETLPVYEISRRRSCNLIFHYWNYNRATWALTAAKGRKAIHYHNITPTQYFSSDSLLYRTTALGYAQLPWIANQFDLIIGDSLYNVGELSRYLRHPRPALALYPIVEPAELAAAPYDANLLTALRGSGEANILFVGRIARNKRQDRLIQLFDYYWRKINRHARLWLVGNDQGDPEYYAELTQLRQGLPSREYIMLTGKVPDDAIHAYFLAADVLVCASEHEGFCVPIAQAMAFDVPVLAYDAAAVAETMGGAGVLASEWDTAYLAEVMHLMIGDRALRDQLIAGQRAVLGRFSAVEVRVRLKAIVDYLTMAEWSPLFINIEPGVAPTMDRGSNHKREATIWQSRITPT